MTKPRSHAWRRLARLSLLALLLPCPGCVWLQNEFFVFDAPPPQEAPESGTDLPW